MLVFKQLFTFFQVHCSITTVESFIAQSKVEVPTLLIV